LSRVAIVIALLLALLFTSACGGPHRQVIVIGVDGMDPGFVERHWAELPNLDAMRHSGSFQRLATTSPPQSPVAWSTFITGLDPGEHGIFDFVHRDAATRELFLSTDRTVEGRFALSIGAWRLPLSGSHVESLRKGKAFWQTLAERGVPVTVVRMPTNYPPLPFGKELAGMGTPDLRGTQGTFQFYTDAAGEDLRAVSGGLIRKVALVGNHAALRLEGPPNSLRADRAYAAVSMDVDVDPALSVARFAVGNEVAVLQQGEWSGWLPVEFPLAPYLASVRGMVRVYAKQLKPGFEVYISPVNVDPLAPALPLSEPAAFARRLGRFYTQGIGEDTAALRNGVFTLPEFLKQSRMVLQDEQLLLRAALDEYRDGFLFFYFSAVDQNSHVLWGWDDIELLKFYQAVDASVGEVHRRLPGADLMVMSDHGFTTFDRAVNLNAWFAAQGLISGDHRKAWAAGLNAVYLDGAELSDVKARLLAMRDDGRVVVQRVDEVHAVPANRSVAPDLVVGYAPGYRASWATGLGETAGVVFEENSDAWIADHCVDADAVPGVLFLSGRWQVKEASLKELSRAILGMY
jgi:hypothetical protein